jgi:hypothetical protein
MQASVRYEKRGVVFFVFAFRASIALNRAGEFIDPICEVEPSIALLPRSTVVETELSKTLTLTTLLLVARWEGPAVASFMHASPENKKGYQK